jgi:hypothetical protein
LPPPPPHTQTQNAIAVLNSPHNNLDIYNIKK